MLRVERLLLFIVGVVFSGANFMAQYVFIHALININKYSTTGCHWLYEKVTTIMFASIWESESIQNGTFKQIHFVQNFSLLTPWMYFWGGYHLYYFICSKSYASSSSDTVNALIRAECRTLAFYLYLDLNSWSFERQTSLF